MTIELLCEPPFAIEKTHGFGYRNGVTRFNTIVIPEPDSRLKPFAQRLERWAESVLTFDTPLESPEALVERIRDADAVLLMGGTRLNADAMAETTKLRYIGLGATLFATPHSNVDLAAAEARGVPVTGVREYGDRGVAEWVASESVRYLKSKEIDGELYGKRFGVIGAGDAGGLTARVMQALGATVCYFSRSRKPHLEDEGIEYQSMVDLLETCEIVSIHVPRHTSILGADELRRLGSGKLLFNTSVGLPIEPHALRDWLATSSNRFAADIEGIGELRSEAESHPGIIFYPRTSGYTAAAAERLYAKVERNLKEFLKEGVSGSSPAAKPAPL